MKFRRWVLAFASLSVACVGDSTVVTPDASSDAAPNDVVTSEDVNVKEAGVSCTDAGPPVFQTGPVGAFCGAGNGVDGGNSCAPGAYCCLTQGAANTCASSCPGTSAQVECNGAGDCPQDAGALVCCADGTIDDTSCSYPIFKTLLHATCAASCTGAQVTFCGSSGECQSPTKCVGAATPFPGYTVSYCR